MSVALPLSLPQTGSVTVRQFRLAVVLAFIAVLFACVIYVAEKYVFGVPRRFVENPTDIMVRACGVAHFLVGWLFMFTSRRTYSWAMFRRLGGCALLGGAFCVLYSLSGSARNPIMAMIFYSFFLVHEVRDQADLFMVYGDGKRADVRVLGLLRTCVCLLFITVLASAYLVNGVLFNRNEVAQRSSPELLAAAIAVVALLGIVVLVQLGRLACTTHGGLRSFAEVYRPLLTVYGGILLVLLLGSVLGSVGFNLIILIHVTSWLIFVHYQLTKQAQREPTPLRAFWRWLRHSPWGFVALHISLVGLILVLLACRVYYWQRGGVVSVMLASSSFPYWSFMHIALAFARTR